MRDLSHHGITQLNQVETPRETPRAASRVISLDERGPQTLRVEGKEVEAGSLLLSQTKSCTPYMVVVSNNFTFLLTVV